MNLNTSAYTYKAFRFTSLFTFAWFFETVFLAGRLSQLKTIIE